MKAIILAAGYTNRLYPLIKDRPKPLLTIRKKPVIEYIIARLESLEQIDQVFIVTNQKFFGQFQDWLDDFPSTKPIKLINDDSVNGSNSPGAIRDIDIVIKREQISEDLLVVAGDNLFSFGLRNFIEFAGKKKPQSSIGIYNLSGKFDSGKFGVVQINSEGEIVDFQEKPSHCASSLVATCLYFFPGEKLRLISDYLNHNHHDDAAGDYISWLVKSDKVYGYSFNEGSWLDVGDTDAYTEAVFTF